ncbi:MAG: hypothetical protein O7G31_17020 [Calditrichaeota bacterium]|nr:hypothetical protein [Calditrichota bacterium]
MNVFKISALAFLLLICQTVQQVSAQYILAMEKFEIPEDLLWTLGNDEDLEDPEERTAFFASLPESKYLRKAEAEGITLEKSISTIYVDGNNFAVESMALDEGKMTFIYLENGDIYMVMWNKKKVIKTSQEEINQMKKDATAMISQAQQNMPNMDALLSKYMTEEQKQQMQEAMNKLKGMGQGMPDQTPQEKPKVTIERPGTKRKLLGTEAELYIAKAGKKVEGIWAIDNDRALAAKFLEMGENMTAAFEMEGLKEIKEWEIIPGKFPASKTTVEMGMRGGRLSVDVEYYTSIKRETPTADKFVPPGKDEGFTQGTLMDLMPGMNSAK